MKINRKFLLMLAVTALMAACTGKTETPQEEPEPQYAGQFTDEFGNRFVLNDDQTATIQFAGISKVNEVTWKACKENGVKFATISFNGDPAYYYLHRGYLYRYKADMDQQRCPIVISYDD